MPDRHFYLSPVLGGGGGRRYPVHGAAQRIGRAESCEIVLREPSVSRKHARIRVGAGGQVLLKDLGSKHGTFLNARRVRDEVTVRCGDLIVCGLVHVLRLDARDAPMVPERVARPAQRNTDEPTDEQRSTVSGREALCVPAGAGLASPGAPREPGQRDLSGLGTLCLDLLPPTYARLAKLVDTLESLGQQEVKTVELASIQQFVRPVLDAVSGLMEVSTEVAELEPKLLPLVRVVDDAIARCEAELALRQIALQTRVPHDLLVRCDGERLAAALAGLVRNAGQNVLDGGLVDVVAAEHTGGVVIRIIDQGERYPDELLQRAFHQPGPGLPAPALRIWQARKLVLALGGVLTVTSREGVGSTVRITLPGGADTGA